MVGIRGIAPRRVALVTAIVAAVIMGDSMIYNVLPANVSSFGVSVGLVGVLLSANRVVRLAANPLAAWVVERYGTSAPLMVSALVAIGTTALLGVAKGFALLLLARLLWGVCFSVFRISGYLIVLEESSDGSRGRLLGFFSGGQRLGSLVGVLLGGILFDVIGRSSSFLVIAALGFLSMPAALALGRHTDSATGPDSSDANKGSQEPWAEDLTGVRRLMWDLLVSRVPESAGRIRMRLLAVNFTFFSVHLVMSGLLVATLGFYLNQRLGEEATVLGVVLGIATVNGLLLATRWASDVGSPYLGYMGDRWGQERIFVGAAPVCVITLLLLASDGPLWLTLPWLPLTFLAMASAITALTAMAGSLSPAHRRAQVMSRFATWQDLGSALGPLLAFAVLSSVAPEPVYLGGAVFLAAALGFFVAVFRPRLVATRT